MALSVRECWVVTALPALLTAGIYIYGPGKTVQTAVTSAQTELQKEQANPVDLKSLEALRAEFDKNQEAIDRARKTASAPRDGKRLGPESEDRNEALRFVSNAVEKHNMKLFQSEQVAVSSSGDGLPKRTRDAWKTYSEKFHAPAPQLWRIVLRGSYPNMQKVCDELLHAKAFVAPIAVTMETPGDDDPRGKALVWTLTLWL